MGYPSEIPNSIPTGPRDVPVRGRLARWVDGLLALLRFGRRRRTRADAPARYGQGVDPALPPVRPLTPAERERLDVDEIVS